jgi:hypothetical protein
VGVLIGAAAVILLTGLVVAIRDLRRPAAASPRALTGLQASLPSGGPVGGQRPARERPASAEGDPPAMAA